MQDNQFFFDNFSSYLTSPMVKDSGLDLSNATIMEILSEYANFIQWAHMRDNCYSSIKLYCNQLKSVVDIDRYSIIPKLTHSLLEKYNYTCPYKGNLNNFNMYLHRLLRMIGEEFNDIVITEVKANGKVEHISHRKWELCTSHTGRRSFITYNVMRCPTEIEVGRCSGHSSSKTFERYISMDED